MNRPQINPSGREFLQALRERPGFVWQFVLLCCGLLIGDLRFIQGLLCASGILGNEFNRAARSLGACPQRENIHLRASEYSCDFCHRAGSILDSNCELLDLGHIGTLLPLLATDYAHDRA